jgi:hypothetical protein
MKHGRIIPLLILIFLFEVQYNRTASAQDQPAPQQPQQQSPPPKPSPDNPPSPVPAPQTVNPPAQQPQPATQPAQQQQQPTPDTNAQPQQVPTQQTPPPNAPEPQYPYEPPTPPPLMRGEKYKAPWQGEETWGRFSRVGIGADFSTLGIGIKGATILTSTIDLRLMGNFFNFNTALFDIEGTRTHGSIHFASLQTAVDFYPKNSIWRLSAGALLWSGNEISAAGTEEGGTSFTVDGKTYYSSKTDPVMATGAVGFHTNQPAFTLAGGFGRYVPRSARHWSFPAEFGVVFMGPPSLVINPSGTVCTTAADTPGTCSDVNDTSNPVGAEFNQALQSAEARWRRSLARVTIYPIISYAVVYSFTIRNK